MGKYDHIEVHAIEMDKISSRVVPGGVSKHKWHSLGIKCHHAVYIGERLGRPAVIRDEPKKLAALIRKAGIDAKTVNILVVGSNRSAQSVSTDDKLFVWVNVSVADVENHLRETFLAAAQECAQQATQRLAEDVFRLVKEYAKKGFSPESMHEAVKMAFVKLTMEA